MNNQHEIWIVQHLPSLVGRLLIFLLRTISSFSKWVWKSELVSWILVILLVTSIVVFTYPFYKKPEEPAIPTYITWSTGCYIVFMVVWLVLDAVLPHIKNIWQKTVQDYPLRKEKD